MTKKPLPSAINRPVVDAEALRRIAEGEPAPAPSPPTPDPEPTSAQSAPEPPRAPRQRRVTVAGGDVPTPEAEHGQLSVRIPRYVLEKVHEAAAKPGQTLRRVVLEALRTKGFEVRAADLVDRRAEARRRQISALTEVEELRRKLAELQGKDKS